MRLLSLAVPRWRIEQLRRRLGGDELGWLLHHAIGDAVAAPPPAPFSVGGWLGDPVFVHAWSRTTLAAWRERGQVAAARWPAERVAGVTWPLCREFELALAAGQRWRFEVRAAAIRRVWGSVEEPLPYADRPAWFAGQMAGCVLDDGLMAVPSLLETTRRAQWQSGGSSGPPRPFTVPMVTVIGGLTVTDPVAFEATLARGVGRHRSYGLGMIRLSRLDAV